MSIILQSSGGGSVTIAEPTTASNFTQTLPAATGNVVLTDVAGTVALSATGANIITASTNSAERMRIDSSGNFYVSKTAYSDTSGNGFGVFPNSGIPQVSCVGAANSTQKNFTVYSSTDSAYKFYVDYAGNGYYANILFVGVTASIGGLNASGHFKNVDAGAAGIVVGNAGGTSTTNAILFTNSNGIVGGISTSGSSTSFNTASDYRLKENVLPMTNALATITALKPVTYKWKIDGSDGQGFIAHELQSVVPDCVTGEKDATETYIDKDGNEQTRIVAQGIDTSYLVATLTAAIQELNAKVDAQALEIQVLKGASE